jgi:hypothetical protein
MGWRGRKATIRMQVQLEYDPKKACPKASFLKPPGADDRGGALGIPICFMLERQPGIYAFS